MDQKLNIQKHLHHQMMIGEQNQQNQDGNVQEDHQKVQIDKKLVQLLKVLDIHQERDQ